MLAGRGGRVQQGEEGERGRVLRGGRRVQWEGGEGGTAGERAKNRQCVTVEYGLGGLVGLAWDI